MTEVPDKFREEAKEIAAATHGAARDDKDARHDALTAQLLDMYKELQKAMFGKMDAEGEKVQDLKEGLGRLEGKVDTFIAAFPNKDPVGHLLAHEKEIKDAEKRDIFREKMKFLFWGLAMTAVSGWVLIVVWKAFLAGPK